MIIDSHTHFPVTSETGNLQNSKVKLLNDMFSAGIDYAIMIPDNQQVTDIGNLNECLEVIDGNSKLFLMGTIDILNDNIPEVVHKLDNLFFQHKIVAVKIFPGHDPIYPTDERLNDVYKLCDKHNKPIVIHTGWNSKHPELAQYNEPNYIVQVAKNYPDLKIIISHYFWPKVEYCYKTTRGYKNIYFDTSGLADREVVTATGKDKIKNMLERTLADNPNSIIFGTDYDMCTFQDHIELINSLIINKDVKEMVFYKNSMELFDLSSKLIK